jgi:glutamine synthetase
MTEFNSAFNRYCKTYGRPDRIDLMLCDINGVLRGKWFPADHVEKLEEGGVRLPLSTYAPNIFGEEVEESGYGIAVGDPDCQVFPIPGSLSPVTWESSNVAQVLVEMETIDGTITELSPRGILSNIGAQYSEQGLRPVIGCELEFYIFDKRPSLDSPPIPNRSEPKAQNYDMEVLDRNKEFLLELQEACKTQSLDSDVIVAEFGPGQFEVNFQHTDDIVGAADTAVLFRRIVRGVALKYGKEATFMAKPYTEFPGSGMHLHASVLNELGNNIFSQPKGVSQVLKHAVSGVLSTMRDLQAIFAPHMNSYRRFQPNSFAPSAPNWGLDNRNAAVRLPDINNKGARLEHRICGADVNPYLAFSGILGGILYGIKEKKLPPLPIEIDEIDPAERLTTNWLEAVERFAQSEIAAEIFGFEYCRVYAAIRRNEIEQLSRIIPPIEYQVYLSRF